MKIAIDVRRIDDFGVGTYIRNLLNALSATDPDNQYTLIAAPGSHAAIDILSANFRAVPYLRSDLDRREHLRFASFVRGLNVDLVHIPLNRVPLIMPRPYVVTVHDIANLLFEDGAKFRLALRRFRFRRGLTRASKIMTVSAATRRDVQNLLALPDEQVRVVYSAPDPNFFRGDGDDPVAGALLRSRILERYQIHYPFLLYAGSIRPQKNIPRLIEAFAVARQTLSSHPVYRDLRLIIIGDEISRYPQVRRTVIQSRVEDSVRFLGFVPFETLRIFYAAAAAFVFPSLYEGFGLPPLEAMASGTPVVTSSVSSLPESTGDAAVLVNPENVFDIARGIEEVLLNEGLRTELIERGWEQAQKFNWFRTAREVVKIYLEAVQGRS